MRAWLTNGHINTEIHTYTDRHRVVEIDAPEYRLRRESGEGPVSACPEGKTFCPCPEFSKEGLCDWPYWIGMSYQEIRYMTEILQLIDKSRGLPEGGP